MKKMLVLLFLGLLTICLTAPQTKDYIKPELNQTIVKHYEEKSKHEFEIHKHKLLMAFFAVESNYNEKAINKKSKASGMLQIMKVMVREVNRIISLSFDVKTLMVNHSIDEVGIMLRLSKENILYCLKMPYYSFFKYNDRFNMELSVEMFCIAQGFYNPGLDIKQACKLWNPTAGNWYYERVLKKYNE